MKNLLLCLSISTGSLAFPALAAERISITEWSQKSNGSFITTALEKELFNTCSDCDAKETLKKARSLFAKGQFDEAITSYNQIPRGTTYWLLAVEEKGWAQFRKDDFEKALAQSKTLLAPQFAEIVNTEAYLLQSLSQLKICDYKGVLETHQTFKEKQKSRIMEVQKLAQSGWNDSLTSFLRKVDKFPLTLDDMGEAVQHLPLLIYKDVEFQKQALRFKVTEKAMVAVNKENARLNQSLDKLNAEAFRSLKSRVKELAQAETNDNFKTIQKLNLVEVEAIQRIHTDQNLSEANYKKNKFRNIDDDQLMFMDDGRPWIDELDKFEVSAKTCVQGIRRKM